MDGNIFQSIILSTTLTSDDCSVFYSLYHAMYDTMHFLTQYNITNCELVFLAASLDLIQGCVVYKDFIC